MGMLKQAADVAQGAEVDTPETDPAEETAAPGAAPEASPEPAADDTAQSAAKGSDSKAANAYKIAFEYLQRILYMSGKGAEAIVRHLQPNNKVGSAAYTVMFLVGQVITKVPLVSADVFKLAGETTNRVLEMFTRVLKVQFTPEEQKQVLQVATQGLTQAMKQFAQEQSGGQQGAASPPSPGAQPNVQEQAQADTAAPVPNETPPQATPPGQPPVDSGAQ
jgi:hypothetical protein